MCVDQKKRAFSCFWVRGKGNIWVEGEGGYWRDIKIIGIAIENYGEWETYVREW